MGSTDQYWRRLLDRRFRDDLSGCHYRQRVDHRRGERGDEEYSGTKRGCREPCEGNQDDSLAGGGDEELEGRKLGITEAMYVLWAELFNRMGYLTRYRLASLYISQKYMTHERRHVFLPSRRSRSSW